jgi:hypothetical protein
VHSILPTQFLSDGSNTDVPSPASTSDGAVLNNHGIGVNNLGQFDAPGGAVHGAPMSRQSQMDAGVPMPSQLVQSVQSFPMELNEFMLDTDLDLFARQFDIFRQE